MLSFLMDRKRFEGLEITEPLTAPKERNYSSSPLPSNSPEGSFCSEGSFCCAALSCVLGPRAAW